MTHTDIRRRRPVLIVSPLAVVLVGLLAAPPAGAGQANKWWQSDHFQQELLLTQEQVRRIEQIFQEAVPALHAQKKVLDDAEAAFERVVERGDEPQILAQVERVERARSELNVSRTMMLVRMRRVLTTDQWAKFTALYQAAERERLDARERTDARDR